MKFNTPPRIPEIEEDDGEIIFIDNEIAQSEEEEEESPFELGNTTEDDGISTSPIPDDAEVTFKMHLCAVFSGDLHPSKDWAATGSEDDSAYIWNIVSGEIVYEVQGHTDTVIATRFSYDGTYLATGDMAGEIQVFKITDAIKKVWQYSMGDMSWMFWHRAANVLLAGSEENGEIYVWRIPSGDCKILPGNGCKCETAELTGDGKKLLAGYANGSIKLWDIKNMTVVMEIDQNNPMRHMEAVTAVSCDHDSPLYMSGGQDGKIVFSSNNGPIGSVEASGPVECVEFSPSSDLRVAVSGSLHGQIAIWDYKKYSLRTMCDHTEMDDGLTKIKWINENTFIVATIQGNIFGYDARSGLRKFTLRGHLSDVYELCYDSQRNILLTVSEDFSAKIFKIPQLGD